MAETKYIIFELGNHKYSTLLSRINGIEHVYNIVPVPVGAKFIKGIIHLRDQVVPVYNLKEKFGIYEERKESNVQLLVAETHGIKMGFEVDDVIGIVPVPEENIKKVPSVVKAEETGYLENVIKVDNDIMLCISVDRIMSEHEYEDLSDAIEEQE